MHLDNSTINSPFSGEMSAGQSGPKLLKHFKALTLNPKNAQELKGLILQLAIQGKLTAQWRKENPDVEPASFLLDRIKAKKAQLAKEKKIRKEKKWEEINSDEFPFELPNTWEWTRLGEYTHNFGQKKPDVNFEYVDVASIDNTKGTIKSDLNVISPKDAPSRARKIVEKGCVIYSTVRPYLLNIAIVNRDFKNEAIASTAFAVLNPLIGCSELYLYHLLRSIFFIDYVESTMKGVAYPAINDSNLLNGLIPIPPLEEQKAIVEVVYTLFKEVEQLEQLTQTRVQLKTDFVTSALQELTQATEQDTATQCAFLQEHFSTFFTEKANIKKLRESILQLAVQGKLTKDWREQRSESGVEVEDASVLLERIKAEKEALVQAKKIKKEKPLPAITEEEIPYELPEGWVWSRMIELCQYITDGTHQTPKYTEEGRMFLSAKNVKPFQFMPEKHRYVSEEDFEGYRKNKKPELNDILLTRVGAGIGEATLIDQDLEFAIYVSIGLLKMFKDMLEPNYIVIWLNSPEGRQYSSKNTYGKGVSQGNLNLSLIRGFMVSIPPLAEQKAIVSKVNALMALCDTLEYEIETHQTTQHDWMRSCLREVFEE